MSREKEDSITYESAVARFLTEAINNSPKTQVEIAKEIGFTRPNVLSMIKRGQTKLPITKVKSTAKSLGIEPKLLLKLCFEEYQPGNWEAIEEIFNDSITN